MIKRLLAAFAFLALASAQAQAAIVGPLPYTLTNGQPADAAQVMANFNKIVNDVNVNVIFPSFTQQSYYAVATGTANALIVGVSPTPTLYAPGMVINAKVSITNTGPATINVNGLGSQNIVNMNGGALKSQQMLAGQVVQLVYDGTQFQLQSQAPFSIRQVAVSVTTQLFTAAGAWTWTVPAGVYAVRLEAWGGGAGGGGSSGGGFMSGGGASGAYGLSYLTVVPGDVLSGAIGAGGAGGTTAPTAGVVGGNTTVLLNGVLQGTATGGGGGGQAGGAPNYGGQGNNVSGSWNFSATGDSGTGGQTAGAKGGTAPRGGVGGAVLAGGCQNGGNPGGGGSGSQAAGCAGGNGWVYLEY